MVKTNTMRTLGIVLIVAGIVMMVITGFNYFTTEEVVDIGPLEVNKETKHPVRWSPILGSFLLLGGIILVATNKKKIM
jgi:drug/metabolite transporter (DMT)-like permease